MKITKNFMGMTETVLSGKMSKKGGKRRLFDLAEKIGTKSKIYSVKFFENSGNICANVH